MRRSFVWLVSTAAVVLAVSATLAVLSTGIAASASASSTNGKQRIALVVKIPLDSATGEFVLEVLTPGPLKGDSGSITFTSGPTPVFIGRIIRGQSIDRFRATDLLEGEQGTLAIRIEADFASAGNGYHVGTGHWSIISGTGAYSGLTGGGGSALAQPPVPPGTFGFAQHEGFVKAG